MSKNSKHKTEEFHNRTLDKTNSGQSYTKSEKAELVTMWINGKGEKEICNRFKRAINGPEDLMWKIFSNRENEGSVLVRFMQADDWYLDRTRKPWTRRESTLLGYWQIAKESGQSAPLSIKELSILLGRSVDSIRKEINLIDRQEGFLGSGWKETEVEIKKLVAGEFLFTVIGKCVAKHPEDWQVRIGGVYYPIESAQMMPKLVDEVVLAIAIKKKVLFFYPNGDCSQEDTHFEFKE